MESLLRSRYQDKADRIPAVDTTERRGEKEKHGEGKFCRVVQKPRCARGIMGLGGAEILGILKMDKSLLSEKLRWVIIPKTSLTPHLDDTSCRFPRFLFFIDLFHIARSIGLCISHVSLRSSWTIYPCFIPNSCECQ